MSSNATDYGLTRGEILKAHQTGHGGPAATYLYQTGKTGRAAATRLYQTGRLPHGQLLAYQRGRKIKLG